MNNIQENIKPFNNYIPMCYAYTTPQIKDHNGWTKIGYTERNVEERIKEQTQTADIKWKLEWKYNAIYEDGSGEVFKDYEFHNYLKKNGIENKNSTEWFKITGEKSEKEFLIFRKNKGILETEEIIEYELRKEQKEAVKITKEYFENNKDNESEFLWNAKPRFGKTLSTYDLCKSLNVKTILIITNRPAIANSWYDDYVKFLGTKSGYYFVSEVSYLKNKKYVLTRNECLNELNNKNFKGYIEFLSLQDLKGSIYFGGSYNKLKEIKDIKWDLLVIDEAHEGIDTYKTDTAFDRIERKWTLHLSGTPFKALANNKFNENEIFNWTYVDEQKAKKNWDLKNEKENPYQDLPQINLYTYKMSDIIEKEVEKGLNLEDDTFEYTFDLNEFFSCNQNGEFKYNEDVDKFLDSLTIKEKFPFSSKKLRDKLKHTFWLLDRVDSAKALAKKLKNHPIFNEYEIILVAGDGKLNEDQERENSFNKVRNGIKNNEKTITLSVGQLTTGITIPEWSAVLMLSNIKSPSLYMQSAFRAQNPYKYKENGKYYKKENCYVFDFDPARTLEILEKFANNLSPNFKNLNIENRKENIKELLNFFSVYGEDENGKMVELDSEKVLSIPRKIHSQEVVKRGFMCNFLFQNITNIFNAPKEVIDIIQNFEPIKEQLLIKTTSKEDLDINNKGEIEIPEEKIIGIHNDIFGDKVYKEEISKNLNETIENISKKEEIKEKDKEDIKINIKEEIKENINNIIKEEYKNDITNKNLDKIFNDSNKQIDNVIDKKFTDFEIKNKINENERNDKLNEAKNEEEVKKINNLYDEKKEEIKNNFIEDIKKTTPEISEEIGKENIKQIEKTIKEKEKLNIENDVRDRLRGFSRSIPSFLMGYGDEKTTLENFEKIIPENVFKEVTSITIEQFIFLRDGGEYKDKETNEIKHFEGKLFNSIVFNDSIKEFLNLKEKLSNYFENNKEDIFDYIPPQKTNQIFTPKKVVKEMIDNLEKENPNCFDDEKHTFIDLYMKSGLYITEIVKKLYNSEKIKKIFPDSKERLKHIFEKQVYGLAPTEIIYKIALSYILGFNRENFIIKHNLKQVDTLPLVKNGILEKELENIFKEG